MGSWLSRTIGSIRSRSSGGDRLLRQCAPPPPQRGSRQMLHQAAPYTPARWRSVEPLDFSSFNDDDELVASGSSAAPQSSSAAAAAQPEPDIDGQGSVTMTTRVEYAALPRGREQDIFGIVTLQAEAGTEKSQGEQRQPLDLICVLDVSGSMGGAKIQLVKDAMRFVVKESQPGDRVSIVTFSSAAARQLRLRRMDAHGKDEAMSEILKLQADGGTNIASGLETALQIAERRRQRNAVSAILLLTDGQDGSRAGSYATMLGRAQRAGCSLYCFGFGADHDARLLSDLAEQAQTPFTFVEDVDHIGAAFAGAMGGLASVVAQDVKVVLECQASLKAVHTPFSVVRDSNRAEIQIPDLLAGERRDVLVELRVPEQTGGDDEMLLLKASARYSSLAASATVQTPPVDMLLQRTPDDEPQPEMEPDEEVVTQRQRVEVAQTLQEATTHGDAGRFDEAQRMLNEQAGKLKAAKKPSAVSEGLVLELEDAQNRMKSQAAWQSGGAAELRDACRMHRMQRATNMSKSKASCVEKRSKEMYVTSVQRSWVSKLG